MSSVRASSGTRDAFGAPFRHSAFAVIWTATVVSNVGGWMYSAASGWLMTGLNPDPFVVALVQAASSLPICVFAIPAGALADIFDKRRYLIVVESLYTVLAAAYAAMIWIGLATPINLLFFTFLLNAAGALTAPAWQAVVPQLVPRQDLSAAIAANSVGVNISRAVGPALGGAMISTLGIVAPFWVNAVSNLGIVGALVWWREQRRPSTLLPAERFGRAMLTGLRYARHNFRLRCTLIRAIGFFLFASAYWALLPLVARNQIVGGPSLYGVLLGTIGAGAVGGAFLLPWMKSKLEPNRIMALGALGQAVAMVLYGFAREPGLALIASVVAGASWIAALATLGVSAQVVLPGMKSKLEPNRIMALGALGQAVAMVLYGFACKCGCWRIMDRGAGHVGRLGAGRAAGLGARAGTRPVHHGVLWLSCYRQRRVGRSCRMARIGHSAFPRCRRRRRCHTFDLALEVANWRGRRSVAVDALAGANHHTQHKQRSWAGSSDRRVPYSY
jgi:MFS family permease